MINANKVFQLKANARSKLILGEIDEIDKLTSGIDKAREIARVLNIILPDYFNLKIEADSNRQDGSILTVGNLQKAFNEEINRFKPIAIEKLKTALPSKHDLISSSKNVYEMAGAVKLSFANKATRNLSTTMGMLWERLASISPYAINPELEFNIKIKGIDIIALNVNTNVVEYQQLKTQHNTLTGSQKGRSVEELLVHEHPVFCACFANKSAWTFNHPVIPRVSGDNYWSRIGIPYQIVESSLKELILDLEKQYVSML